MSNAIIRSELETKLANWANAQNPKIPIAFEQVPFTKPTTGTYLETYLIPTTVVDQEISGQRQRYVGIFQVNCLAREGSGMGEAEDLAQSIVDLFPILPKSGLVSVEQTPYIGRPLSDNTGWIKLPVTIKYRYQN